MLCLGNEKCQLYHSRTHNSGPITFFVCLETNANRALRLSITKALKNIKILLIIDPYITEPGFFYQKFRIEPIMVTVYTFQRTFSKYSLMILD